MKTCYGCANKCGCEDYEEIIRKGVPHRAETCDDYLYTDGTCNQEKELSQKG